MKTQAMTAFTGGGGTSNRPLKGFCQLIKDLLKLDRNNDIITNIVCIEVEKEVNVKKDLKKTAFTHARHCETQRVVAIPSNKTKSAFTLAEVLITLGIIGIIAAMTLPAIVGKYQKAVTVQRLKKFYATIQEVVRLSELENGSMADWDYPMGSHDTNIVPFFRKYYLPFFKGATECNRSSCVGFEYAPHSLNGSNIVAYAPYIVKLNDGKYLYFFSNTPNGYIWMYVDINGRQKPNIVGKDIFVLYLYNNLGTRTVNNVNFWGVGARNNDYTTTADYGCNPRATGSYVGFYCGIKIMSDGWEMKEDYPW